MRYGLLGETLRHSFSPQIHALFGLSGYELMEVPRAQLEDFLRRRDFDAINVTIPYKRDVIPLCDHVDPAALEIGAVNTIVNRGGRLLAYNTDFSGFLHMAARAGVSFPGKKVLVLGSGGTSRTACAAALSAGCRSVHVVSRRGGLNYENAARLHPDADILVNTTPVGMYPHVDGMALSPELFPALSGALDVIYNPLCTDFILCARRLGIPCSGGLPMLVAQAKFAEELSFGRAIPDAETERVLRMMDSAARSIILTGMPGCGKSSAGRMIAEAAGREFFDIDEMVERDSGLSIPEIFASRGEAYFRELESAAVQRACLKGGAVVSLGGGSILREENRRAIARSGFVVYIRRDVESLPTGGRPLSAGGGAALRAMLAQRDPIYRRCADCICDNSGTLPELCGDIMRKFNERSDHA